MSGILKYGAFGEKGLFGNLFGGKDKKPAPKPKPETETGSNNTSLMGQKKKTKQSTGAVQAY